MGDLGRLAVVLSWAKATGAPSSRTARTRGRGQGDLARLGGVVGPSWSGSRRRARRRAGRPPRRRGPPRTAMSAARRQRGSRGASTPRTAFQPLASKPARSGLGGVDEIEVHAPVLEPGERLIGEGDECVDAHRRVLLDPHDVEVAVARVTRRSHDRPVRPRLEHVTDRGMRGIAPGPRAGRPSSCGGSEGVPRQVTSPACTRYRAPGPSCAALSSGFSSAQRRSERQPQPMQPVRRPRIASSVAMRSSSSSRQLLREPLPVALGRRAVGRQRVERRADALERDARRLARLDERDAAQRDARVAALVAVGCARRRSGPCARRSEGPTATRRCAPRAARS